ncbi:deleted in azoospermia-like [Pelodytes ibericus]
MDVSGYHHRVRDDGIPPSPKSSPLLWSERAVEHLSTSEPRTELSTVSDEEEAQLSAVTSHGYVLPEGKIMPNTVFVGGIDVRMDEIEIRDFFSRFGSVKEVKIITDRTGVSKGYGFVSFYDDVDVQKIVDSQINFHGKKLKLGPAIRKQQNICAYVQPRPMVLNQPAPQFHSVWGNQNLDPYLQHPQMISPVTQYVQACPYPSSPPVMIQQLPVGYQQPGYYQVAPQWTASDQRSYIFPPAFSYNYHCNETDPCLNEVMQPEFPLHEQTPSPSGSSPQKKSVDRSIQTVVSCLFNSESRLQRPMISQERSGNYISHERWLLIHGAREEEAKSYTPGRQEYSVTYPLPLLRPISRSDLCPQAVDSEETICIPLVCTSSVFHREVEWLKAKEPSCYSNICFLVLSHPCQGRMISNQFESSPQQIILKGF